MKAFIHALLFAVGFLGGVLAESVSVRLQFEDITGINWYSFFAAHADCEAHFKEPCKLGAGFRPLSQLR